MRRKRIALLSRRPDLTAEQFDVHWRTTHVPFITALPGIEAYVQNPVLESWSSDGVDAGVDGIVEVWFDDGGLDSPAGHTSAAQQDDEVKFIGSLTAFTVGAREHYDAEQKVWVLHRDPAVVDGLAKQIALPPGIRVTTVHPDPDTTLMIRPRLAREQSPTSALLLHEPSGTHAAEVFGTAVAAVAAEPGFRVLRSAARRIK